MNAVSCNLSTIVQCVDDTHLSFSDALEPWMHHRLVTMAHNQTMTFTMDVNAATVQFNGVPPPLSTCASVLTSAQDPPCSCTGGGWVHRARTSRSRSKTVSRWLTRKIRPGSCPESRSATHPRRRCFSRSSGSLPSRTRC